MSPRALWERWCRFWFGYDNPLALALMRVQLAAVMLWMYVWRHLDNLGDYGPQSMIPRELALSALPEGLRPAFAWFFWPDSAVAGVHGLFLGLLLLMLLGVGTRVAALAIWVLHMGFLQRNYAIVFGADVISAVLLFYLAFARTEDRLSVASLWRREAPPAPRAPEALSSMFARLLQVQIAVIYAYTGFEKLRGASWWDGTALWTVLGNPQMVAFNMDFVRGAPLVIAALTFATILFEIYWPAAVLSRRSRGPWLAAGVLFHAGIGAIMSLWTFSLIMLSAYWLFVPRGALERAWSRLKAGRVARNDGEIAPTVRH